MRKTILGWVFTALGAVWLLLGRFTEAITMWPDLHEFWSSNMNGQPWIPWIVLLCGIAVLAVTYWPTLQRHLMRGEPVGNDENNNVDQSVNIGAMSGGTVAPIYNNHFQTTVAPGRVELSDTGFAQLRDALLGEEVQIDVIGDAKGQEIGQRLISRLASEGVVASNVRRIGVMSPPPSDPYTVIRSRDGKMARLVISPSTMP